MVLSLVKTRDMRVESGWSGLKSYGGRILGVDFNPKFDDLAQALTTFNRMYLSDSQIRSMIRMVSLPIVGVDWSMEGGDKRARKLVEEQLLKRKRFREFVSQACLCTVNGFAPFEKVWENVDGTLVLKKLSYRKPTSVYGWKFDKGRDEWVKMVQYPREGDTSEGDYDYPEIDREKMVSFVHDPEADNPQGTSAIRSAYGDWYLKEAVKIVMGIGGERWGAGIPVATISEEHEQDDSLDAAESALYNLRSHEKAGLIEHKGVTFRMMEGPDPKIMEVLLKFLGYLDNAIAKGLITQFANVGTGEIGSKASAETLRDLFVLSDQAIADNFAEVMSDQIADQIVSVNLKKAVAPRIKVSNILVDLRLPDMLNAISQGVQTETIELDQEVKDKVRGYLRIPKVKEISNG